MKRSRRYKSTPKRKSLTRARVRRGSLSVSALGRRKAVIEALGIAEIATPEAPDFKAERQMRVAERVMERDRDLLRELAKQ
jgi:hypothetical protein